MERASPPGPRWSSTTAGNRPGSALDASAADATKTSGEVRWDNTRGFCRVRVGDTGCGAPGRSAHAPPRRSSRRSCAATRPGDCSGSSRPAASRPSGDRRVAARRVASAPGGRTDRGVQRPREPIPAATIAPVLAPERIRGRRPASNSAFTTPMWKKPHVAPPESIGRTFRTPATPARIGSASADSRCQRWGSLRAIGDWPRPHR